MLAVWPCNSTPRYLPKGNGNIAHEDLDGNVRGSSTHDSEEQPGLRYTQTMQYCSAARRNEPSANAAAGKTLETITLPER